MLRTLHKVHTKKSQKTYNITYITCGLERNNKREPLNYFKKGPNNIKMAGYKKKNERSDE